MDALQHKTDHGCDHLGMSRPSDLPVGDLNKEPKDPPPTQIIVQDWKEHLEAI